MRFILRFVFLRLYKTQRNSYSIFLFLYLSIFSSIAYTMIRFILRCSLLLFIPFAFILTNEITIIYHPTPCLPYDSFPGCHNLSFVTEESD